MTEKDINIEEEENLEEVNTENTENTESAEAEKTEEAAQEEEAEELDPLEKAQAELAEIKNQLLYKAAEFENYRKRTLKERAELILNGGEKVITAILPVLDDMERAIANGSKTEDPQVLREGMELIYQKFVKTLEAQGVSKIETKDADFDTDLHEAVAMVPGMGDDKKGKVIDCLQDGYKLNDKVIRHAKVAVGQ
ncbi:MAG: nucleotide exchange factor GrpE [Prevotella ruminicola]|jgi:molecular chaperone GrpE|uniref:Protein GrpE n=1 Tax=Xylanibacter ruminicola TaxID=839 RepID=A0A928BT84_XYLRU|nr:nucleotide exchange factor GrpE [Xylanibacter ruminicola]